jgi:hypothetical protein
LKRAGPNFTRGSANGRGFPANGSNKPAERG